MSITVHPSSVIEDGAIIGDGAEIGPFCHIGPKVKLGVNAKLISHVVIAGNTSIGDRARIFPFASVGHEPQDLKYHGEENSLEIGDDCLIREGVTMNPGTEGDDSRTIIGNACKFLAYAHIAHDCKIGNNVIFSNSVMLAGHCKVGDNVIMGGGAGVHQFCRIGKNAFVGGLAGIESDVIPYGMALGNRAYLGGLNLVGMKRMGIKRESIHKARNAFKQLFSEEKALLDKLDSIDAELGNDPIVSEMIKFIREGSGRSLCTPRLAREG